MAGSWIRDSPIADARTLRINAIGSKRGGEGADGRQGEAVRTSVPDVGADRRRAYREYRAEQAHLHLSPRIGAPHRPRIMTDHGERGDNGGADDPAEQLQRPPVEHHELRHRGGDIADDEWDQRHRPTRKGRLPVNGREIGVEVGEVDLSGKRGERTGDDAGGRSERTDRGQFLHYVSPWRSLAAMP